MTDTPRDTRPATPAEAHRDLERKSSAVTLSDMEVFIFPELMYALVLANIMSPRIWEWRSDPWFAGFESMTPYRRITRLKQFIMDHYAFNLDLDTWGLTDKQREIERFKDYVSPEALAQSNALFGYEGDKYYFDIDIRTHFGLDKYEGDVIPYWKTETVEAMDAFRHKPAYDSGAGECVSLAALYAAALFVVARIPLSDIYLMATPLHSQNFIDTGQGVLTNNRRLVTKNMWFNGSALSAQARRALENERVTVVAHETGYIHILFDRATIAPRAYDHFAGKLRRFLQTPLTPELLGNYVRHSPDLQKCFQARWQHFGVDHYITMEKLLAYEQTFPFRFNDDTRERLMMEVAGEDFETRPLPDRIVLDDLEALVKQEQVDIRTPQGFALMVKHVGSSCVRGQDAIEKLRGFCWTDPRLPDPAAKSFERDQPPLGLEVGMERADVVARLESLRDSNELAALAFYAYRDLNRVEPDPFVKAALERCPVSVAACEGMADEAVAVAVEALDDESIYDEAGRLAQPDEVWNYRRGDGAERALLLANVLRARHPGTAMTIDVTPDSATLRVGGATTAGRGVGGGTAAGPVAGAPGHARTKTEGEETVYRFSSHKELRPQTWDCGI
ncbi:MAG: hypothetical protein JXA87_14255 [Thermoleophilia bacterium]|nr:hypothetical protein [Thermoleophilia bacterium]